MGVVEPPDVAEEGRVVGVADDVPAIAVAGGEGRPVPPDDIPGTAARKPTMAARATGVMSAEPLRRFIVDSCLPCCPDRLPGRRQPQFHFSSGFMELPGNVARPMRFVTLPVLLFVPQD